MSVWSLTGTWRIAALDPGPSGPVGPEVDDSGWDETVVPGHWTTSPDRADRTGPFLFRRAFTVPPPDAGRRRWVEFDGIVYQADMWLDGAYLGDHEGYFAPHAVDITALSRLGADHVLAVAVTSPRAERGVPRRAITGVHGDPHGPATRHAGGIWAPVRIAETGPVRLGSLRILCRDADGERAHLLLHARLDADTGRVATVRTTIDGVIVAEHRLTLAGGINEVSWNVDLRSPRLWWPSVLGRPDLIDVVVDVDVDGEQSDRAERRTGLRQVRWDDWVCSVNGERLFLKGANLMPAADLPGAAAPVEPADHVRSAAAAGLDLLRVNGHVAPEEVYRTADEVGMLLMQDFPLVGVHARQVRNGAMAQARAMVDLLGHHPSILTWTAHDEPGGPPPPRPAVPAGRVNTLLGRAARLAVQQLPTWNRTILDRWVQRTIAEADPTRRCIPHSGVLPHLPRLDGADTHLHLGWSDGPITDLARESARFPRLFRFVSEFGAPGAPDAEAVMRRVTDRLRWPTIDRDLLDEITGLDTDHLDDQVPPARFTDENGWRQAMDEHQADVARRWIEHLRRVRYRPTGGFCLRAWNDHSATSSWGVHDHTGHARPVLAAVIESCAPVVVIGDRLPLSLAPGARLRLGVHVVSDLRQPVEGATVSIAVRGPGIEIDRVHGDTIPADSCVRVTTIDIEVPDRWGEIEVGLTLAAGDHRSTWRDRSTIDVPLT
jgi:beta-mannosidase